MPPTIGGVGIDPQGQTLAVTITPAAKVYTDAAGTTLASFPQTITSVTKWYVSAAQEFTISALADGIEVASGTGTTRVVNIEQGEMQVISVTIDRPGEDTSHSHAYVPIPAGIAPGQTSVWDGSHWNPGTTGTNYATSWTSLGAGGSVGNSVARTLMRVSTVMSAAITVDVSTMVDDADTAWSVTVDGTHEITWPGGAVWHSATGAAPSMVGKPVGSEQTFYFFQRAGTLHIVYESEALALASHTHNSYSYVSGNGYWDGGAAGVHTLVVNNLYCRPFQPKSSHSFSSVSIEVTTVGAGSTARVGLYDEGTTGANTGLPNNLLSEVTGFDVSTATGRLTKTFGVAQTLDPSKRYWVGVVAQGGSPPVIRGLVNDLPGGWDIGATLVGAGNASVKMTGVTGSLPSIGGTWADGGNSGPRIMLIAT